MNILFVSPEVAPFSKTGGLGDVAGALPRALAALGHDVRVVTPLYSSVRHPGLYSLERSIRLRFPFGEQTAALRAARLSERHEVIFLDHPGFYGHRGGIYAEHGYEYGDNHRRFAFLAIGALAAAQVLGFEPDIVHLNDWPTGLAAVALRLGYQGTSLARARSVFTIHNLAYQGLFPKDVMGDLGLPWDLFTKDGLEFHDAVNFLKGGLHWSDALTTVSRRYAEEIQTPELGCLLDGFLRERRRKLYGILNGVDYEEWSPEVDPFLPRRYGVEDLSGKAACKRELLRAFGLLHDPDVERRPVFGIVSRLVHQKGIDLAVSAFHGALEAEVSVVVLGSGESRLEHEIAILAHRFPGKVGVRLGFDTGLAHLVEAGSDFFVMPSRYEPCGLNQMYSLRYGTVPVVRATGGLDDTVEDLDTGVGTGIKFYGFTREEMLQAIWRAVDFYYRDPAEVEVVRRRGMSKDFSWAISARRYEELYRGLVR